MSAPARPSEGGARVPLGGTREAEGAPVSPLRRPEGDCRRTQPEGTAVGEPGRPRARMPQCPARRVVP